MHEDDSKREGKPARTRPANFFRAIVLGAAAAVAPMAGCDGGGELYGVPPPDDGGTVETTEDAAAEDAPNMEYGVPDGREDAGVVDDAAGEEGSVDYGVPDATDDTDATVDYGVPDAADVEPDIIDDYGVPDGYGEAVTAYGVPDGYEDVILPPYGVPPFPDKK